MKFFTNPALLYWVFGIIIVITLLILGIMLMTSKTFAYIPVNYRFVIGSLVIAYGAFRLVSIYYKFKSNRDEEE